MNKVLNFLNDHKIAAVSAVGTALTAVPTFAEGSSGLVTSSMFDTLTAQVTADVQTLVPVGVGLFAIMVGISVIPRVIRTFI